MESLLKNTLFTMTCPTCGAQMELDHGDVFQCHYCGRKLLVLNHERCDCLAISQLMDAEVYKMLSEHPEQLEQITKEYFVQNFARQLYEKGYIRRMIRDDFYDPLKGPGIRNIRFDYLIKIIKPSEDEAYLNTCYVDKNKDLVYEKKKLKKIS